MLVVFSHIFLANTKISFGYNFVAPLKSTCAQEANIYVFKVNNRNTLKRCQI